MVWCVGVIWVWVYGVDAWYAVGGLCSVCLYVCEREVGVKGGKEICSSHGDTGWG